MPTVYQAAVLARRRGLNLLGLHAATIDWVTRVRANGGSVSQRTVDAVNAFVVMAKVTGLWGKFRRLNLCAGDNLAASLVPLINASGAAVDTAVNLSDAYYSEAAGWSGDGTNARYLSTGYTPNEQAGGLSVYLPLPIYAGFSVAPLGAKDTGDVHMYRLLLGTANAVGRWGRVTDVTSTGTGQTAGLHQVSRVSDVSARLYTNGAGATEATSSTTFGSAGCDITVLAMNAGGVPSAAIPATARVAAYGIDTGMLPEEARIYAALMQRFQRAMGRAVKDADLSSWLTRVASNGGTVSASTELAVEDFVRNAKAWAIWAKFRRLNLCCGDQVAASVVPLINTLGSTVDLVVNGGSLTYAEATGWTQGAANNGYIRTGAIVADVLHGLSAYVRVPAAANTTQQNMVGARQTSTNVEELSFNSGSTPSRIRTIMGGTVNASLDGSAGAKFWQGTRTALNDIRIFRDGEQVAITTSATTAGTMSGFEIYVMAMNFNGSVAQIMQSGSCVSAYAIDAGMTPTEAAAYCYAMREFQAALGRQNLDPATVDWQTRVAGNSGTASAATVRAVDDFVARMKRAALWAKMRRLNLVCGDQLAASLVPLINANGGTLDVASGLAAGDYSEATGWVQPGLAYINTGYVPIEATGGLSVYQRTDQPGGTSTAIGVANTGGTHVFRIQQTGGLSVGRWGSNVGVSKSGVDRGHYHVSRASAVDLRMFFNGVEVASSATSVVPVSPAQPLSILAQNFDGAVSNFVGAGYVVAGYAIDTGMTGPEASVFNRHTQLFQHALNRAVIN